VQVGELLAGGGERPEVRGERDAGEALLEVVGELGPIPGVVQDGVDVVEDVPLGQLLVPVVAAELLQCPVGETCSYPEAGRKITASPAAGGGTPTPRPSRLPGGARRVISSRHRVACRTP
jgi:hypothetical protein